MFVLWMFGSELESIWGRKSFLQYYFLTGIGSGLVWLALNIANPNYVLLIFLSQRLFLLVSYPTFYSPIILNNFDSKVSYISSFVNSDCL